MLSLDIYSTLNIILHFDRYIIGVQWDAESPLFCSWLAMICSATACKKANVDGNLGGG